MKRFLLQLGLAASVLAPSLSYAEPAPAPAPAPAAATPAPSALEGLFKDAKLSFSKNDDQFEVNVATSPSQSRRVIVIESDLGSTSIKYARVVVIAATFPKGKVPAAVAKMQTTKWDKLPLGRVRVLDEDSMLVVYETNFFVDGATGAQLRLHVELASVLGGTVEKDITAAKSED